MTDHPPLPSQFVYDLVQVTEACNTYLAQQIPANAETAEAFARTIVNTYDLSRIPVIVEVVAGLQRALELPGEADRIESLWHVTNIVEAKNMVLRFRG